MRHGVLVARNTEGLDLRGREAITCLSHHEAPLATCLGAVIAMSLKLFHLDAEK